MHIASRKTGFCSVKGAVCWFVMMCEAIQLNSLFITKCDANVIITRFKMVDHGQLTFFLAYNVRIDWREEFYMR